MSGANVGVCFAPTTRSASVTVSILYFDCIPRGRGLGVEEGDVLAEGVDVAALLLHHQLHRVQLLVRQRPHRVSLQRSTSWSLFIMILKVTSLSVDLFHEGKNKYRVRKLRLR